MRILKIQQNEIKKIYYNILERADERYIKFDYQSLAIKSS